MRPGVGDATAPDHEQLLRRGLRLAYFIIVWDVVEFAVAVSAGIAADSIALIGFGLDSAIEVFAATVVAWHLRGGGGGGQKVALRLIAMSFFALGIYVAVRSVSDLISGVRPEASVVGIVLNAVALVVMVPVAIAERKVGRALPNGVLVAQSAETWLSNYLSISLLVGLGANALFGWWWADPVVALLVAGLAVRSGIDASKESSEAS